VGGAERPASLIEGVSRGVGAIAEALDGRPDEAVESPPQVAVDRRGRDREETVPVERQQTPAEGFAGAEPGERPARATYGDQVPIGAGEL